MPPDRVHASVYFPLSPFAKLTLTFRHRWSSCNSAECLLSTHNGHSSKAVLRSYAMPALHSAKWTMCRTFFAYLRSGDSAEGLVATYRSGFDLLRAFTEKLGAEPSKVICQPF